MESLDEELSNRSSKIYCLSNFSLSYIEVPNGCQGYFPVSGQAVSSILFPRINYEHWKLGIVGKTTTEKNV